MARAGLSHDGSHQLLNCLGRGRVVCLREQQQVPEGPVNRVISKEW